MTEFIYKDRGKEKTLVLIPGWATDHKIFETLELDFNYFIPLNFSPFGFESELLNFLKTKGIKDISIFGWSLGGFLAASFASRYPGFIKELILVSIRKKYKSEELVNVRNSLKANKKAYLYKFYNLCLYNKEAVPGFKKDILKVYCRQLELSKLLNELDYLENAVIDIDSLKQIKELTIIHGDSDRVAPLDEVRLIKNELKNARLLILKECGHMPFLEKEFNQLLNHG